VTHLLDTWAWVAYFQGTSVGKLVKPFADSAEHATSIVTVAELSDVHHSGRGGDLSRQVAFVRTKTRILPLTPAIAEAAGATKWRQRARGRAMGLADALIYETARAHDLVVLTGDPGFAGLDGVEMIGP
jgi:predicted nucleic acid-binding protein